MQGAEYAVVPPMQSEMIVNALRGRGVPVAYVLFGGEQHSFLFYRQQVLGVELPSVEGIEPVEVENLTR